MFKEYLIAKIHHATVTECCPEYNGSITIDEKLMGLVALSANQKVLVADCENGNRFETYVIAGEYGSGIIGVNGAAAQLTHVGNRVIIMAFGLSDKEPTIKPHIIVCANTSNTEYNLVH